jgi:hypothetical protein
MRKTLIATITLIWAFGLISVAQIPNAGFENWTSVGSYFNPDEWGTMNNTTASSGIYTATKGTPGNPGSFYLKLTSRTVGLSVVNGIAVSGVLDPVTLQPVSGFAFTQRPASFKGKWQHMIFGNSQGSLAVALTRWNTLTGSRETIATASKTLAGMAMSWAPFTLNFVYQSGNAPDTCIIMLKASGSNPSDQDYLWVDDLVFEGTVAGISDLPAFLNNINIYPVPAAQTINIDLDIRTAGNFRFELRNPAGEIVKSGDAGFLSGQSKLSLDVTSVTSGTYFLILRSEQGVVERKVMIL